MAIKKQDYSKRGANTIFKNFQKKSGVDPLIISNKPIDVYFRALLYKVLVELNYMNDRQVEAFFLSKGVQRKRCAIYLAITKIDLYYDNYADFREVYDTYFDDKLKEEIKKKAIKDKEYQHRMNDIYPSLMNDKLQDLVNNLPANKREEMFEVLNLRVKSWSWKSKDQCEIVEASEGIESNTF